jgi:hypothetical protein
MLKIDALDARLKDTSVSSFDVLKHDVERVLCDNRLLEVRQQYERKIVERFVESCVKGLRV